MTAAKTGKDGQARYDHKALCLLPDRMLEDLFRRGTPPERGSIVGWEFDGYNTGTLAFAIRKFRKGYYEEPAYDKDEFGGYNVNIKQSRMDQPWVAVLKKSGEPQRHSFFRVYSVRGSEPDNNYPNALLLNYHSPKTPAWNPASRLRDYLVQVYPDNPDLLLGKAYAALPGGKRLFVSFFVLQRACKGIS
jgi:hypothetical protein